MSLRSSKQGAACEGATEKGRANQNKAPSPPWPIRAGQSDHKLLISDLRGRSKGTEHKGGTLCISKSKEWNGLAPSPTRTTYPTSLKRVKCVALSNTELLSGLQACFILQMTLAFFPLLLAVFHVFECVDVSDS